MSEQGAWSDPQMSRLSEAKDKIQGRPKRSKGVHRARGGDVRKTLYKMYKNEHAQASFGGSVTTGPESGGYPGSKNVANSSKGRRIATFEEGRPAGDRSFTVEESPGGFELRRE